jgi:hypothetical protein
MSADSSRKGTTDVRRSRRLRESLGRAKAATLAGPTVGDDVTIGALPRATAAVAAPNLAYRQNRPSLGRPFFLTSKPRPLATL